MQGHQHYFGTNFMNQIALFNYILWKEILQKEKGINV